jgi:hypothetical protein
MRTSTAHQFLMKELRRGPGIFQYNEENIGVWCRRVVSLSFVADLRSHATDPACSVTHRDLLMTVYPFFESS